MLFRLAAFLVAVLLHGLCAAQSLTKAEAITFAEKFIAENGYTDYAPHQIKPVLDPESLDWGNSRDDEIALRHNSLAPRAIGIKRSIKGAASGWIVAFDFSRAHTSSRGETPMTCRVVTMDETGAKIVMKHSDGIRSYFVGGLED